ncbi:MAG: SRPBCC domain-containing protein [Saprospiraceae bacterium]|nr:SRPBCC domain-containing protein [Candidatus Vicinibacter affinis]MBK9641176.1 SRPBCC domain-containing protein [Candidatus Vicinibacter affinis]MBK9961138.1 SRPBCC domain-containing protein [Candidatus Vicinibacter affinis]MBP6523458.1 SRPBCC domain-containing protein [Saprospiraceae bacterium]HQX45740.1 SRPBCC domain-containing protein [Saprospiraceae bacterium]
MAEEKIIKNTIQIIATPSKVWDALVNPDKTKKYMFGCETVSDWKVGSSLLWKGEYNGQSIVFVKGNIIAIDPGKFLAYTVIDPNNNEIPDLPENYLTVTYSLIQEDHHTTLTVTQGDYSKVAEGEKRYQESYNNGEGWNPILVQIKNLVESDSVL